MTPFGDIKNPGLNAELSMCGAAYAISPMRGRSMFDRADLTEPAFVV